MQVQALRLLLETMLLQVATKRLGAAIRATITVIVTTFQVARRAL